MDNDEILESPQDENPEEISEEVMLDEGEAVQEEPDETPEEPEKEPEKPINPDEIEIPTRKVGGNEPIDYGEDVDPEDVTVISKVVEKQTESVRRALQDTQDRAEIDSFIKERPEFEKYRGVMEKYIKHPVYSQIPVKNIAAMVASDELMRIGAKKEREAQMKADSTKQTGNQVRKPSGGQKDWTKASKADFEAQKMKILGQH